MATNDEIIESLWGGAEAKYTIRDTLLKVMNEARASTAKQIFAELDAIALEHVDEADILNLYKELSQFKDLSKAKDKKAANAILKKFSIIEFKADKYDALKKKYEVD